MLPALKLPQRNPCQKSGFWSRAMLALLVLGLQAGTSHAQSAEDEKPAEEQSALTPRMFYNVLVGELQLQQWQQNETTGLQEAWVPLFEAAVESKDERLFERALQIAVTGRDGRAALQVVRAWKQAHPLSSTANRNHIQVLLALNRAQETLPLLAQELRRSEVPQRKQLLEHLPQIYAQVPDKAKLADMIEPVLKEDASAQATSAQAQVALAKFRALAGQPARAMDWLRAALATEPHHPGALALAVDLIGPNGTMAEALVATHLSNASDSPDLRFAYARKLIQLERTPEAVDQLQKVIAARPTWPAPHLILGTLAAEQNNPQLAESSIQNYLRLQKESKDDSLPRGSLQAHMVLSGLAVQKGDYDRALYWLDQVKDAPDSLSLQIQRANILSKQGKLNDALELLDNEQPDTLEDTRRKAVAMAALLREHQQYQRAYDLLGLWKTRLRNDAELMLQQSFMAEKLQRFDLMESLLREHIRLYPKEHGAYNALGYNLADRNERLPEAKSLIEKALSIVPGDPYVTDSLAWVEFRMGQHERARELLEQTLQRKPDAEIAAHLAEVYWAMGERSKATDMLLRAHALGPDNETLIDTARRLGLPLPANRKK
jgi:tetratricopeptide (TPR) repeat protein